LILSLIPYPCKNNAKKLARKGRHGGDRFSLPFHPRADPLLQRGESYIKISLFLKTKKQKGGHSISATFLGRKWIWRVSRGQKNSVFGTQNPVPLGEVSIASNRQGS
jgi:hypothetical protein